MGHGQKTIRSSPSPRVNRFLEATFLGRGIIDPVDDIPRFQSAQQIRRFSMPSRRTFIEHKLRPAPPAAHYYKTRATYQASMTPNEWNAKDFENFSHGHSSPLECRRN